MDSICKKEIQELTHRYKEQIYKSELAKLEDSGWEPTEEEVEAGWRIEDEASERAQRAYWDRVDEGRQRAKDGEL